MRDARRTAVDHLTSAGTYNHTGDNGYHYALGHHDYKDNQTKNMQFNMGAMMNNMMYQSSSQIEIWDEINA